jgi:putative glutamine amidotransferase
MQMTNVVAGGTLIQDIPSQVGAEIAHRGHHMVKIEPGSLLDELLDKDELRVWSYHHQAVKDLADGFKVAARSADGVIEAMERTGSRFALFVQWHPEATGDIETRSAIYGALVRAAAGRN